MWLAAVEGTDCVGQVVGSHEAEADTYGSVERWVANVMDSNRLDNCVGTE